MTDAVNIKDAWICNITVEFAIYTKRGFNKNIFIAKRAIKLRYLDAGLRRYISLRRLLSAT